MGQSIVTWLCNLASCTMQYKVVVQQCARDNSMRASCWTAVFSSVDVRCCASPNHLAVDLLTPGPFALQMTQLMQGMIANSCYINVIVLNLAMYQLCNYHLYDVVHADINTVLFTAVGLPISTCRRCDSLAGASGLLPVHVKVCCTPDWQHVSEMTESLFSSLSKTINNLMNNVAVLVNECLSGRAHACETSVPMRDRAGHSGTRDPGPGSVLLLVLNSVTSTQQWIHQPEAVWGKSRGVA